MEHATQAKKRETEQPLSAALRTLWDETLALVPQQVLDAGTKKAMQAQWVKLSGRFGMGRFRVAVEEARMHTNWFPTSKEILDYMPDPEAALRIKTNEKCEYCGGSGWKDTSGAKLLDTIGKTRRVERCDCRTADFVRAG